MDCGDSRGIGGGGGGGTSGDGGGGGDGTGESGRGGGGGGKGGGGGFLRVVAFELALLRRCGVVWLLVGESLVAAELGAREIAVGWAVGWAVILERGVRVSALALDLSPQGLHETVVFARLDRRQQRG